MWAIDPADVFEANLESLDKIYYMLTKDKSKNGIFCKKALIEFMTHNPVRLSERDAYLCFGMSKMTIKDESQRSISAYNVLKLPEFYEYIARVATVKYKEIEDMPLSRKIENILDLIFPPYGFERVAVNEGDDDSSSDDSIDFE